MYRNELEYRPFVDILEFVDKNVCDIVSGSNIDLVDANDTSIVLSDVFNWNLPPSYVSKVQEKEIAPGYHPYGGGSNKDIGSFNRYKTAT